MGFLGGVSCKELACQRRRHKRHSFDPWVGRSPGGGHGNPLQLFLPGEIRLLHHGQRSLADYSPWDLKESDTTKAT